MLVQTAAYMQSCNNEMVPSMALSKMHVIVSYLF